MNSRILAFGTVLVALSTLFLPFMAVGDITTGVFAGVVKKPELLVFLSPALVVGLLAALGGALGFPKRRIVVTMVFAALNLAAFVLLLMKLKDGATAGLAMWGMGVVPILAVLAAVLGRTGSGTATARA